MSSESDGIDEALQGVTQVAMTAAARMGEQLARLREAQLREAQARSEQAGRELASRLTAEREAARAALAPVSRPDWWAAASGQDVAMALTTARAWRDSDTPDADFARAEQRIVDELRTRYGVDVPAGADAAAVSAATDEANRARSDAREERTHSRDDQAEAAELMAAADAVDAVGAVETGPQGSTKGLAEPALEAAAQAAEAYDSAVRRDTMAQGLDHVENRLAVQARVTADVAQARHASDAVSSTTRPAATRRVARPNGQPRGRQRGVQGR